MMGLGALSQADGGKAVVRSEQKRSAQRRAGLSTVVDQRAVGGKIRIPTCAHICGQNKKQAGARLPRTFKAGADRVMVEKGPTAASCICAPATAKSDAPCS